MPGRSFEPLTLADLRRLGELAAKDRQGLFERHAQTAGLYADRLFAVCLCQGAAVHYLAGKNGIKDFDVWSFYRAIPSRPFPYRRRGIADFGDSRFGTTDDCPEFVGRRVDFLGRSLESDDYSDPVALLCDYLQKGATESARFLAEKAVILIEPSEYLGVIVWPGPGS